MMNKTMELFRDSAANERRIMMFIKLQGHRLSDPIRIVQFQCRQQMVPLKSDGPERLRLREKKSISDCS